ncbi:hypothetical protein QJS04_geneDACA000868 [Acorus gramineus]|uniref:Uncharacterized protein n=1 Tax=Acorus gramineus TaxID=55184 RepID=A0AAV9BJ74_ACOGR|nr:hypothetical protein QJS04_geneDACA000868 [Acorus gramineus]
MVGGGIRRDEGPALNSANVFAALETLRRKKKSDGSSKKGCSRSGRGGGSQVKELEPQTFWAPTPLTTTKWADVDDDDDDYYAPTAPPPSGAVRADERGEEDVHDMVEEVCDFFLLGFDLILILCWVFVNWGKWSTKDVFLVRERCETKVLNPSPNLT